MKFNKIEEIVEGISTGEIVIITDNKGRENEGDLVFAANFATPEKINFMIKHARGLVCAPISEEKASLLGLPRMVEKNTDRFGTAFTISVDAKKNVTSGISAYDRATTLKLLSEPNASIYDFTTPGHIFPLIAKKGGVLERPGHTEAVLDLIDLAKIPSRVGVICEIINDDGTMKRGEDLELFAKEHNLKIGSIDDLIEYKKSLLVNSISLVSQTNLPTHNFGEWKIFAFYSKRDQKEQIALVKGDLSKRDKTVVRIHSECFTGDLLGSMKCDCHNQLFASMKYINEIGNGLVIYLKQEGRGIGLGNKLKAYNLQEQGFDTLEANVMIGFPADARKYDDAIDILNYFDVKEIDLITNNPEKIKAVKEAGIAVSSINIPTDVNEFNRKYLITKQQKFGHSLVI